MDGNTDLKAINEKICQSFECHTQMLIFLEKTVSFFPGLYGRPKCPPHFWMGIWISLYIPLSDNSMGFHLERDLMKKDSGKLHRKSWYYRRSYFHYFRIGCESACLKYNLNVPTPCTSSAILQEWWQRLWPALSDWGNIHSKSQVQWTNGFAMDQCLCNPQAENP